MTYDTCMNRINMIYCFSEKAVLRNGDDFESFRRTSAKNT